MPALSSSASSVVVDLVHYVTEKCCAEAWLRLLDAEMKYIMALARLTAEKRKEAAQAALEANTEN